MPYVPKWSESNCLRKLWYTDSFTDFDIYGAYTGYDKRDVRCFLAFWWRRRGRGGGERKMLRCSTCTNAVTIMFNLCEYDSVNGCDMHIGVAGMRADTHTHTNWHGVDYEIRMQRICIVCMSYIQSVLPSLQHLLCNRSYFELKLLWSIQQLDGPRRFFFLPRNNAYLPYPLRALICALSLLTSSPIAEDRRSSSLIFHLWTVPLFEASTDRNAMPLFSKYSNRNEYRPTQFGHFCAMIF